MTDMECAAVSHAGVSNMGKVLLDTSEPISKRFRMIFTLRNIGGHEAIDALVAGLSDKSALLKHEIAYVLGQMSNPYALPFLEAVLRDESQEAMVRHEAAEAMGAIADPVSLPILEEYQGHPTPEIAETCQIAIDRIRFFQSEEGRKEIEGQSSAYMSVDPAPSLPRVSVEKLREKYLNPSESLFKRYRALFALRDDGSPDAVMAITEGFNDTSALFRHEVAYVLGQMQSPLASKALSKVLADAGENDMVRHEAAEAIGAIADQESSKELQAFLSDPADVVRESCEVATDITEYYTSEQFQYADGLTK